MRKFILTISIVLIVILCCASCANNTENKQNNTSAPTAKPPEQETEHTHVYDNACDSYCNECDEWRATYGHQKVTSGINNAQHQTICNKCNAILSVEAHSFSEGKCSCQYSIPHGTAYIKRQNASCVGYSFDFLEIQGSPIASAGTSNTVESTTNVDLNSGDAISLKGWIGFRSKISSCGYFLNNDVSKLFSKKDSLSDAEQGVLNAGGEFASRFQIYIPTDDLPKGITTINFVVILEDGRIILLHSISVNVTPISSWDGTQLPDDQIELAGKENTFDADMTVKQDDSQENKYYTDAGLVFFANGDNVSYVSESGSFNIMSDSSLKIVFDNESFANNFNKFNIYYSSTQPLEVILTYYENNSLITDKVYLEKDKNIFSCLTLGYINSLSSKNLQSLDIRVMKGAYAKFSLYNITTENENVLSSNVQYIENTRYRLGIKLSWGGGISYLLDKEDGMGELGNLINCYDTGRLIQQSYYGTIDPSEYQHGYYGENAWNYNPVQGGNLYNQASRIIDFEIKDFSIYIKAQPRDWAKKEYTPSYMENVYTVYSDRIQVDNRFVDYSGYTKAVPREQELPAFYTIGYLNTFAYYDGINSWQDENITYEKDLEFWGGNPYASFPLYSYNTETWCAWINNATEYGIGLYTPNIDVLLAGRYEYEANPDTMDPMNVSCSYVAPLSRLKMISFEPLEYSYLISCGDISKIRETFNQNKDFTTNSDLTSSVFSYVGAHK